MTPSSIAGIITAVATVLTALGGVLLALAVFLPTMRKTREVEAKVDEVHKLVNQRFTDISNFNRALIRELQAHDIRVPVDQSIPQEPPIGI